MSIQFRRLEPKTVGGCVQITTVGRRLEGVDCYPTAEKGDGVPMAHLPLDKNACRTYCARAFLRNATQPLRAGPNCGAPYGALTFDISIVLLGSDPEHRDAVGRNLGGKCGS